MSNITEKNYLWEFSLALLLCFSMLKKHISSQSDKLHLTRFGMQDARKVSTSSLASFDFRDITVPK